MKTFAKMMFCVSVALLAVGCVSQGQYDTLQTAYRQQKSQNEDLRFKLEEAQSRIDALRRAGTSSGDADMDARLAQALEDKSKLERALADMEARLRAAGTNIDMPALPADVDAALRELAEQNPELMSYDSRRGRIVLSSDLTFDLGSATLNPAVSSALARLAQVINSPSVARFEAMIVGHTDNVPIGKPETRAKFPTNWHLSVGRAISVMDGLRKYGVAANRFMVGGYGEFRPVVPNGAKGAQANRRVDIYLVANTSTAVESGSGAEAPVGPTNGGVTAPPVRSDEPPAMFK